MCIIYLFVCVFINQNSRSLTLELVGSGGVYSAKIQEGNPETLSGHGI